MGPDPGIFTKKHITAKLDSEATETAKKTGVSIEPVIIPEAAIFSKTVKKAEETFPFMIRYRTTAFPKPILKEVGFKKLSIT